jgi:hypothetical protein
MKRLSTVTRSDGTDGKKITEQPGGSGDGNSY